MHLQRITDWNTSEVTATDWNRLTHGVPFHTWQWYESWWRHYGPSAAGGNTRQYSLFTLCVFDDSGRLIGAAPWYVERTSTRQRIVRFLGSGEVCSDYQTVLCLPGGEDEVTGAIADWLCEERTDAPLDEDSRWDLLQFSCVEQADVPLRRLVDHMSARDNLVDERAADNCWRVDLPPSWDEFRASLSKSHRKQVRRVERRMFQSGRAVHREVRDAGDLPRGFDILVDLHQRRRVSLGESGCFASRRFTAFHREVAARLLQLGALRLSWIELDGRPIAAEYHLAGGGVVYGYQSGLDPAALDDEPGRLAAVATLKRAIETGQTAFDFLRGDEPYKAHWRAEPVPTVDLRVVRNKMPSRLAHRAWLAGEGVKNWVKSGFDLTAAKPGEPSPAESG